jgi:hypothetical protein
MDLNYAAMTSDYKFIIYTHKLNTWHDSISIKSVKLVKQFLQNGCIQLSCCMTVKITRMCV